MTYSGLDVKQFNSGYFTLPDEIMHGTQVMTQYSGAEQLLMLDGRWDASFAARAGRNVVLFNKEFDSLEVIDSEQNSIDVSADCVGQTANNVLAADGNTLSVI